MSDHTLTIEFDGYVQTTLNCHAPADAACHAVWDCDCTEWGEVRVIDGVPHHYASAYYPDEERDDAGCVGRFDPDVCNLREWHENSDEDVAGSVTVPVTSEWTGGCYLFHLAPKPEGGAR